MHATISHIITTPIPRSITRPSIWIAGIIGLMLSMGSLVHAGGDVGWPLLGVAVCLLTLVDLIDHFLDWASRQGASPAAGRIALALVVLLATTLVSLPSLFG